MKQAQLVIYKSENGRDNWKPLSPGEVPDWVKAPEVMGRLVAGEACMDAKIGDKGSDWYRADRVVSAAEQAAQARRDRRNSKKVTH